MTKKTSTAKGSKTRAKVINNSKQTKTSSLLRSKWSALVLILAFIGVGIGTMAWARAATVTYSLWPNSAVPKTITDTDTQSVELGVKFKSNNAGYVTGVRFYKGPQNTGTHTGSLWAKNGQELARVTFKNETAGGWQTAYFDEPVAIAANTTYVVSYHAPNGHYSANNDYFRKARTSGPLTAPKGNNGVYKYGSRVAFPTDTYRASNYWVDVVFSTSRFFPTPKPLAPTNLQATASYNAVSLLWQASKTTDVAQYKILRDGSAVATVGGTATTYTDTQVSAGKTYTYRVQAIDGAGTTSDPSNAASATVPQNNPNPEPNPNPNPNPNPGVSVCPPFPAFPDEKCTGYKHSTGFTSESQLKQCKEDDGDEDGHFTKANAVYDGCLFKQFVRIRAANITIKNSKIIGNVAPPAGHHANPYNYQGLKLIDVEITPFTDAQIAEFTKPGANQNVNPGSEGPIGDGANYTCLRCYIHHAAKSAGGGDNIKFIDSYVDSITWTEGQHGAAFGINHGVNVEIVHNNLDCYRWNTRASGFQQGCSSALSIYDEGRLDNVLVKNNLFNTAGQYCAYSGGPAGKNVRFIDNYFGKKHNPRCGAAGPLHSWYPNNPGYFWQGNVWADGSGAVSP